MFSKKWILLALCLSIVFVFSGSIMAADVVVYNSAGDEAIHERFAAAYERDTGRTVDFLRLSSGEMATRVEAEAGNPQADVVAGVADEHLVPLRDKDLIIPPEKPEYFEEKYPEEAVGPNGYWLGYYTTVLGFGINTDTYEMLYGDKDLPETWDDFLDDDFEGEIVMPNPAMSGTAYTWLITQLMRFEEEEEGWKYIEEYVDNVGTMTASGVAPSRMVGVGEFPIGVTFAHDAARNIQAGFPMEFVVPGKTGSSTGNISVVNNSPNGEEAANHFIEWYLDVNPQQMHTDFRYEPSMHKDVIIPEGLPRFEDLELIDYDPDWAAEERNRILERWEEILD